MHPSNPNVPSPVAFSSPVSTGGGALANFASPGVRHLTMLRPPLPWAFDMHMVSYPNIACSKHSDSGERCEVQKVMKSRGRLGKEVRECVPVYMYQILVYPLIGWFWQFLSTVELRWQREMEYGGDDRLFVPSRRIRTRNKHSTEWLSKRGG